VRVLHVVDFAAPYPGGFIPMIRAAGDAAAARGWRTELIAPPEAAERPWLHELPGQGVQARVAPTRDRRRAARWLRAQVDPSERTLLHGHFASYDLPALAAAAGRRNASVVWHIHNRPRPALSVRVRNTLSFGVAGRGVDRILCVAPDTVTELRARLAPRDRTVFFPNAIDTGAFVPPSAERRRAVRAELGIGAEQQVLLHFGWEWERKGGDVLAATVGELRRRGRDVVALTVGGGDAARAEAERSGVGDALRAVESDPDVTRYHAAADVFVSPSRSEGMPFSVIEALCDALPVVASDVTAGQVAIGTDIAAYRLVGLDPVAFADAVAGLLDRPQDVAAAEAEAARALMRARFDLGPWAERLMGVYEEVSPPGGR
jgi:glycosyltransferase involved in cell wall biosynthesis